MAGQPVVQGALGVDAQELLEVQHAARVGQRRVQAQRRKVGGGVVHPQQPEQHEALDPQPRAPDAQLRDALAQPIARRRGRGGDHAGHEGSMLAPTPEPQPGPPGAAYTRAGARRGHRRHRHQPDRPMSRLSPGALARLPRRLYRRLGERRRRVEEERFRTGLRFDPGARELLLSPHWDDAVLDCWALLSSPRELQISLPAFLHRASWPSGTRSRALRTRRRARRSAWTRTRSRSRGRGGTR